ncbi:MAG TPA: HmuY family protein [Gemmatimonadaceae bacterium]|nr:HmuY family protein [Gemmatimonadaceae bacterium]
MTVSTRFTRPGALLLALSTLAACDSSDSVGPAPINTATTDVLVDASASTAYVRLGDTVRAVTPASPATSTEWDLSLFATTVALNSGAGGPGDVQGYCLCGNENVSNAEIQTLTAANQRAAFDAVTAAQIPADNQFSNESLIPRISGWFTGTGASAAANPARTFVLLRTRVLPIPLYGKFRVTSLSGATATSPGTVTIEYTMQATGAGPLPAARTATITVGSAPVYFDLVNGTTVSAGDTWDIRFEGFLIRANSGASGGAGILVAPPVDADFATLDLTTLRATPNRDFGQDALGGPFGARPWYKYNVTGTDQQIWPNFNVYLVKKGSQVFKGQLTGYYDAQGQSRRITVRSARLR